LYVRNVETIGDLCSQMPVGEPSAEDYLRWLSMEITGLPDMFSGVNEKFATATIEGDLAIARDSVDFDGVRRMAATSGADILPDAHDAWRAARAMSKKW
jgi:hypothetical protein